MWDFLHEPLLFGEGSPIPRVIREDLRDRTLQAFFDSLSPMVLGMFMGTILSVLRGVAPPPSAGERHVLAEAVVDLLLDGIRVREG